MSTTIDSKVVEMRFDNKHFETNVSTTMSTLDKLKQKLHLDGATKGLENINSAAGKVNMSGLANGVETVRTKFSALEVMGVTALANLTNSAVNAGKRIVSALTIDPITTGFNEYELKMDSIKTIMASTGESVETVNKYLNELNEYSDQTIYSFADMTQNIGKFTNAGVKLEDAVLAIKGISNEAAVSGANANEASRAMYNFAQALSAGYVKLIDWKSIENANMATVEFKQQLIDAAVAAGTLTETTDGMYETLEGKTLNATKNFNDTLQDEWMTTEVLVNTLRKYADNTTEIGKKAFAAAQDVTKLTQVFDILKETAQSGWARTWEIVFGNIEQAKAIFTPLTEFLSGIINKMSDFRNFILEVAFNITDTWESIMSKLDAAGLGKIKDVIDSVGEAADKLKYYQDIVNKVWRGDYNNRGDNPDRKDLLTAAGYNYDVVQSLVNKGYQYKLTVEDIEEAHKKFGITVGESADATKNVGDALAGLSDEQLKNAGLTEDEINLFRALEKEANRAGISIEELVDKMSKTDGRTLLIESIKNLGNGIVGVFTTIKNAWVEIFNPPGAGELAVKLYGILEALNKFTEKLRLTDKETGELNANGKKLQRTFEGIFAVLDILVTVIGGPLKIAFKLITQVLGMFNLNILDVTAVIGDILVGFRNWIKSALDFTKVFEKLVEPIKNAYKAFKEWFNQLKSSENLPQDIAKGIASAFGKVFGAIKNFIKKIPGYIKQIPEFFSGIFDGSKALPEWTRYFEVAGQVIVELGKMILEKINGFLSKHGFATISEDSIAGLVQGFKDGAGKVWDAAVQMASTLVAKVKEFLGIHSPSKVFFAIGGFIIAGLIAGLQNGIPDSLGAIKDVFQPMLDWIKSVDWGAVFSAAMGTGILIVLNKFADGFSALAGLGDMFEEIGDSIKEFFKGIKYFGKAANNAAKSLKYAALSKLLLSVAIAIGVLAASVFVLSLMDQKKVWSAVGAIAALILVFGGLIVALQLLSKSMNLKDFVDFGKMALALTAISASLLLMAIALRVLSGIQNVDTVVIALVAIMVTIASLMKSVKLVRKDIAGVGPTLLKIAAAMLILALVAKIIAGMSWSDMGKAGVGLLGMTVIVSILIAMTKSVGPNIHKAGPTILKIAAAMLLLTIVAKIIANMSWSDMGKAAIGLLALTGIMYLLVTIVKKYTKRDLTAFSSTMLSLAGAMAILTIVAKIIAGMTWGDMAKAGVGLLALTGIMYLLVMIVKKYTKRDLTKLSSTLLAMSVSIGILALVATLLGFISIPHLAKGIIAVGLLGAVLALMITATKGAQSCQGNIYAMSVAIGVMALAIIALSFLDPTKLAGATIALAIVMGMFALMTKASSNIKSSLPTLMIMIVAIIAIAGVIALLTQLPVEATISSAVALSVLLLAVSGSLAIVSKFASAGKAIMGALALTAMAVPLLAFVGVLAVMQNVNVAMSNVLALTLLATAMTLLLIPLTLVGSMFTSALLGVVGLLAMAVPLIAFVGVLAVMQNVQNAMSNTMVLITLATAMTLLLIPLMLVGALIAPALLGVVGLLAMAIPMLAFVGILALMQNIQNATENTNLLIQLMSTMTAMLVILAVVGPFAMAGITAVGYLTVLMVAVGALAVGIGALMEKFPVLEKFLDAGIPILEKLAHAIGSFIGNLIGGFIDGVAGSLPGLGQSLSDFMTNASGFIEGAKTIDMSVLEGVGILAGAVIALTAADLLSGISSFLTGGSSFADLGTQLSQFMLNAMPFITGAKLLDPATMEGVKSLADVILTLTGANILEGLTSWFTGGTSLSAFGAELASFGPHMKTYADAVAGIDGEAVRASAEAAKNLAEMAESLPNEGGWLGAIFGENGMDTFGEQLKTLGTSLVEYSNTVVDLKVEPIARSVDAAKSLSELAENLPNSGGVVGAWFGENDMDTFGTQLESFGTSITNYSKSVENLKTEPIAASVEAAKGLSALAASLPNFGGLVSCFTGDNDMKKFGAQLEAFGTSMLNYSNSVSTLETEPIAASVTAAKSLAELSGTLTNSGGLISVWSGDNDLETFGKNIKSFGKSMKSYSNEIAKIETTKLSSAIAQVKKLVQLAKDVSGETGTSLKTFGESLKKLGKSSVDKFIKAFEDAGEDAYNAMKKVISEILKAITDNHTEVESAGTTFMQKFSSGITKGKTEPTTTVTTVLSGLVSTIRGKFSDFKSAGSYLVTGFANGISENDYKAAAKAKAMARAAARAAEAELQIKSPSRVFYGIGRFAGIGFINALGDYADKADKAGSELARASVDGLNYAIAKVADFVNSDIDSQPTIRPVLDLSDVKTGVGAISGMLSGRRTLLVDTQSVGTISASMVNRQNGVDSHELVSTIKGLRKDIANMPRNTYSINGITYDDGSNISEAVQTLVRAAKMERRT